MHETNTEMKNFENTELNELREEFHKTANENIEDGESPILDRDLLALVSVINMHMMMYEFYASGAIMENPEERTKFPGAVLNIVAYLHSLQWEFPGEDDESIMRFDAMCVVDVCNSMTIDPGERIPESPVVIDEYAKEAYLAIDSRDNRGALRVTLLKGAVKFLENELSAEEDL